MKDWRLSQSDVCSFFNEGSEQGRSLSMGTKILLGCYEIPGWGGASTSSYNLFRRLQRDGLDVHYLNIVDEQDAGFFRYAYGDDYGNPRQLDKVHNCVLDERLFAAHPRLASLVSQLSPDLLLGAGYIAALLMKQAAPKRRLVFLTAGCNQVKEYLISRKRRGTFTLSEFRQHVKPGYTFFHVHEKEAVEASDFIVTHSYMIKDLIQWLFPHCSGKVYSNVVWKAEWIAQDAIDHTGLSKPFSERDIDVIFVASSWLRPEKNYALVRQIVSRNKGLNMHIVGEVDSRLRGAKEHGLVTKRRQLFTLLGRAKTLVCPSLFDAAPGILWEASAMGCNVVASKNCGNWMLCNDRLLVDRFELSSFVDRVSLSLTGKLEDNMDYFLQAGSYQDLLEILLLFCDAHE